jgi:hypothetical protein
VLFERFLPGLRTRADPELSTEVYGAAGGISTVFHGFNYTQFFSFLEVIRELFDQFYQ